MLELTKHILVGKILTYTTDVRETALLGQTLLAVVDLREVYLTVYILQTRLDEVFLGQGVDALIDGLARRRFNGTVVNIADRPQYTPQDVAITRNV